jgi:TolA-binding protein
MRMSQRAGLRSLGLVCALSLVGTGCQQLTPEARQQLSDGVHAYEKGNFSSANTTLGQFIEKYKEAPEAAEASYVRGLCQLKLNHRSEARRDFDWAVQKSARRDLTARAQASLAVMAYDDGDWATAGRLYAEAIPWVSDIKEYDEHLLRYGVCMQRLGQWDQSRQQFAQIIQKYPSTPAGKAAKEAMGWNRPFFTIQCHALSRPDAAAGEVARLRKLGLEASHLMETRQGHAVYLIQVGQYKTYDEARQALERVKRNVPTARIMP